MGNENTQMAELQIHFEAARLTEESLHGIVEPVRRQAFPLANRLRGAAEFAGRDQQGIDIPGGFAGVEHQAHDRATGEKQLTPHGL